MELTEFAADLLAKDAGAVGRNRLVQELTAMETAVKGYLDKGLAPEEALKARTVSGAIGAARQIVDHIWDSRYN